MRKCEHFHLQKKGQKSLYIAQNIRKKGIGKNQNAGEKKGGGYS